MPALTLVSLNRKLAIDPDTLGHQGPRRNGSDVRAAETFSRDPQTDLVRWSFVSHP